MKKQKLINLDEELIEALGNDINVSALFNELGWDYIKKLREEQDDEKKELKRIKDIDCPVKLKEWLIRLEVCPQALGVSHIREVLGIKPSKYTYRHVCDLWREIHNGRTNS